MCKRDVIEYMDNMLRLLIILSIVKIKVKNMYVLFICKNNFEKFGDFFLRIFFFKKNFE